MSEHVDKPKRSSRRSRKGSGVEGGSYKVRFLTKAAHLLISREPVIVEWVGHHFTDYELERGDISIHEERWGLKFDSQDDDLVRYLSRLETKLVPKELFVHPDLLRESIRIEGVDSLILGDVGKVAERLPKHIATFHFLGGSVVREQEPTPAPASQVARECAEEPMQDDPARMLAVEVLRSALADLGDPDEHLAHIRARLAYVREGAVVQ